MIRRLPRSTRTDTLFPYATLFRSLGLGHFDQLDRVVALAFDRLHRSDRFIQPPPLAHHLLSGLWIVRSEEHTSELQSLMRISYAVFCLIKKITLIIFQFVIVNILPIVMSFINIFNLNISNLF